MHGFIVGIVLGDKEVIRLIRVLLKALHLTLPPQLLMELERTSAIFWFFLC